MAPALAGRVTSAVLIHRETRVAQTLRELAISAFMEECELQPDIEVHSADVQRDASRQRLLVDDERRHKPSDDDEIFHHVAELRRYVEARCPDEFDLLALVLGRALGLVSPTM